LGSTSATIGSPRPRFLASHRTWSSTGIDFEVCDLYDVPDLKLKPFDVTTSRESSTTFPIP